MSITMIGIPFGFQMAKLAKLTRMPFGAEAVCSIISCTNEEYRKRMEYLENLRYNEITENGETGRKTEEVQT